MEQDREMRKSNAITSIKTVDTQETDSIETSTTNEISTVKGKPGGNDEREDNCVGKDGNSGRVEGRWETNKTNT